MALAVNARQISPEEAQSIASEFFNGSVPAKSALKRTARFASKKQQEAEPYYIFNASDNNGFVIISGDTRAKKILGYSDSGSFDFDNMPPQLSAMLEQYAKAMGTLPESQSEDESWGKVAKIDTSKEKLLQTANFDQGFPYNTKCPIIDGYNCPTGCVPTAMAIIMKYHNWPNQAEGFVEYDDNGVIRSLDLNSHSYQWQNISDREDLDNHVFSDSEIDATSTLIYDCGIAAHTNYTPYESGASDAQACYALVKNFKYHNSIKSLSTGYGTFDYWFSIIKTEINNNRPILFGSLKTPVNGVFAHEYVGDGYNEEGYIHFNWGWGGFCNGFYSIDPYEGLGLDMDFNYGIQPNYLPLPSIEDRTFIGSCNNFSYIVAGRIECTYAFTCDKQEVSAGYVVTNNANSSTTYVGSYDLTRPANYFGGHWSVDVKFAVDEKYPDGSYQIQPAFQIGDENPQLCKTSPYHQNVVEMVVENGIKHFYNVRPDIDPIAPGRIELDGICYILNEENATAEVTFRNEFLNSYSGDINIPSQITVDEKNYIVTKVGDGTFNNCHSLGHITLPYTINEIGRGAFGWTSFKSLNLGDIPNLYELGENIAYIDYNEESLCLPPNLIRIGKSSLDGFYSSLLNIPATVSYIDEDALSGYNVRCDAIKFNRTDFSDYTIKPTAILHDGHYNPFSKPIIFIPEEAKEQYMKMDAFKNAEIIKTYSGDIVPVERLQLFHNGKEVHEGDTIRCNRRATLEYTAVTFPENATANELGWYEVINYYGSTEFAPIFTKLEDGKYINQVWYDEPGVHKTAVKTRDGSNILLTFYVDESPYVENIRLNVSEITLSEGETFQLKIEDYYPKIPDFSVFWYSTNNIVDVDSNGLVTAKRKGQAEIIASSLDGSGVQAKCLVNVLPLVSDITLNEISITLNEGQTFAITAIVTPEEAANKTLLWTSSNEDVATVDQTGLVTTISAGTATITATATDGSEISASCIISVRKLVSDIILNETEATLNEGETVQLTATVLPEDATDRTVVWSSSNEAVAIVDTDGKVIAIDPGEAVITAKCGEVSVSCTVTVVKLTIGDSNDDGIVTVTDAVNTANYAVGNEVRDFFFRAADVNKDEKITLSDASGTIKIVLAQSYSSNMALRAPGRAADNAPAFIAISDYSASEGENAQISIRLHSDISLVAMQGDVRVPEGSEIVGITVGSGAEGHSISTYRIDSRTMRVVLFDPNNSTFDGNDEVLINLEIKVNEVQSDEIAVSNIFASDADANEYCLTATGGANKAAQSGVAVIDGDSDITISTQGHAIIIGNACGKQVIVYNIDGSVVADFMAHDNPVRFEAVAGFYIVRAADKVEKVIIK